jgi:hypothetical protein
VRGNVEGAEGFDDRLFGLCGDLGGDEDFRVSGSRLLIVGQHPDPRGAVGIGGGEAVPIRTEHHPPHRTVVGELGELCELGELLSGGGIPDPRGGVAAGGGDTVPVRVKCRPQHLTGAVMRF